MWMDAGADGLCQLTPRVGPNAVLLCVHEHRSRFDQQFPSVNTTDE